MLRIWIGVLLSLLLWALQDVLLWAVIFEADELWQYIGIYHRGWMVMLGALVVMGIFWMWPDWKRGLLQAAMLISFAFGGLEDALYYFIQLKQVPEALPWLDAHPLIFFSPVTHQALAASVLLWLLIWGIITAAIHWRGWLLIKLGEAWQRMQALAIRAPEAP